jgi:hypothetical protein
MPHCSEFPNPIIISMCEDKVLVTHLQFCEYLTSLTSLLFCTQQFAHSTFAHSSSRLRGITPLPLVSSSCKKFHPIHIPPKKMAHSHSTQEPKNVYLVSNNYFFYTNFQAHKLAYILLYIMYIFCVFFWW